MFKKVFSVFLIAVMLLLVSCGGRNSISIANNDDLQTDEIVEQKENSYKYGDSFKILNVINTGNEIRYFNHRDANDVFGVSLENHRSDVFRYDLKGNTIENYGSLFFGKYIRSIDENNRKFGLKDEIGNVLLGFDYDQMYIRGNYIDAFNFDKDMLYIYDSDLKLIFKNKFYHVLGDGCSVENSVRVENTQYTADPQLANGLINITNKNGKWGYVNLDGKTIIKFNYDYAGKMDKYGYASVAGKNKQGEMKFGLIDRKGNLVIDYQYDKPIYYNPNGIMKANKNGVGYYVNINNEQILNGLKFEETRGFCEGLAAVKMNGKWGFIDKNGSEVIPCIFKDLTNFYNGISLAAYKNYVVVLTYLDELPYGFTNYDVDLSYTKLSQIGNDVQNWINFKNKLENKINTKEWSDIDYENDFNYKLTYKDVQPGAWYVTDAGIWYYFENDKTTTKKGWFVDERDGQTYYLDSKNGRMAVGWTEIDGKMFYFNESHNNEPNWYEIGNGFYESYGKKVKAYGSMFKAEQTPDGYYVDANGVKVGSGTSNIGTSSNDSTLQIQQ